MNVLDLYRLDERVIIITGGAGMLGQQYAQAVAQAGGIPVVADIRGEDAEKVAGKIGGKAHGLYVDITSKNSVEDLVKQTVKMFGKIDGLVNNAAIDPKFEKAQAKKHGDSFEDFPLELWNKSLSVDLTGMFLMSQAVAPAMLAQRRGSIVNISSTYGLVGPDQRIYQSSGRQKAFKPVSYSVTKSGVMGLTRYLATYWAGKGIRVNTLTPGGVFHNHDDEFVKKYSERTTLGRMAQEDEYNAAIVFLLSEASSYMSGSNLVIDGGWTVW